MEIVRTNVTEKTDLYYMTKNPEMQKLSNAAGQRLEITKFCYYKEKNLEDDKETMILSVGTSDGDYFATNSRTVMESFADIIDIFVDNETDPINLGIMINSAQSKNGRTYYYAKYVG